MPSTQSVLRLPVRKAAHLDGKTGSCKKLLSASVCDENDSQQRASRRATKRPSPRKSSTDDDDGGDHRRSDRLRHDASKPGTPGKVPDETDLRQEKYRRVNKKLFSCDEESDAEPSKDGRTPRQQPDSPVGAPLLCLAKADTSLYHKAKRTLTAERDVTIVGRQKEVELIGSFLRRHLEAGSSASMYISGAPGTGKTACLSRVLEAVKATYKFECLFVNCMSLKTSASIYEKILTGLGVPIKGSGHLDAIRARIGDKGRPVVIVLDEVDQLDSKNQAVLYSLFELPRLKGSRAVLFGIANALDLTDRTLPHLQACGSRPDLLHFAPYSKNEIAAILADRLRDCAAVVHPQAVEFCARKIAACTGDVRKALDACRRAVELVERGSRAQQLLVPRPQHGYNPGSPKKLPSLWAVDVAQMARVLAEVLGSRATGGRDLHATLPLQQKLLLCALVATLKKRKQRDVGLGGLQEAYGRICRKQQCATDQMDCQSLCTLLESRGLIRVKRHREQRLCKVALQIDEQEVVYVLQDKALLAACLDDAS
ncbi:cell division control protein 6 homolog [Ixodes scapularis]